MVDDNPIFDGKGYDSRGVEGFVRLDLGQRDRCARKLSTELTSGSPVWVAQRSTRST